ncbi:MAG: hypothetical protein IJW29_04090 [Clostridia bacterium]|nr:hypothetical protein [Clostridia bacterium]
MKRTHHIFLSVGFALTLFAGAILFWCLPDSDFSRTEKRGLQTLPRLDAESLLSGEFSSDVNDYFADQFPARRFFVGVKGACEIASGKGENNGILLGANGQLARRLFEIRRADGSVCADMDHVDPSHVDAAARGIARMLESAQVPACVLLPPRTLDVAADAFRYPNTTGEVLSVRLREGVNSASYLDLLPLYRTKYAQGEYVYYKTDHHWTARGAYYAYAEILRAYGMEEQIIPQEAFEKRVITTDFYGTFWASGGMQFVPPDQMELWLLGNEDQFEMVADGIRQESMYSMAHLETDPYAVLLDGTHDVVTLTRRDGAARPRLLILKDSFANALAPFLVQHFDLILLNLSSVRQDFTNVTTLAREHEADAVLVVYTLGNVIGTDRMNRLQ